MSYECAKSVSRRRRDPACSAHYFVGHGIDIGAGYDSLARHSAAFGSVTSVRSWDVEDGDATLMAGVEASTFDFVHSSHCLEHLADPVLALRHWLRIVKPGGFVIVLVPDEDMYEQGVFPSTFNPDHKFTFTGYKYTSWSARSINLLALVTQLGPDCDVIKLEQLHASFDWSATRHDQTLGDAECAWELILRKRFADEVLRGGRLPADPAAPQ